MADYGRRLLPQVVDDHARNDPDRVYASIPNSTTDLTQGFQDITMAKLAAMVNHSSQWLENLLGRGHLEVLAYVGPADIRYAVIFLAALKCRYKVLFISPRNQPVQNKNMLVASECHALLYADEMACIIPPLQTALPQLRMEPVASLADLLSTSDNVTHYPYERTFEEAQNEPCLILHSSGSTGDPKLVTMTHGTFSVVDNDRYMPVPPGRRAQNAAQFNFEGGGRFYSCFPPYHLAGVHAYIDLPIFSTSATVVFGPTGLPPSGYLLSQILKYQPVRAFYVPPFIIEQWAAEPEAKEQCQQIDFVLYGGGPLSSSVGDRLSQTTDVCQMYGSLEIGQVQFLVPQKGEWSYLELNPYEEADMQPAGDNTFEMVLHQRPDFAARRSLWHNFPNVKTWRTGDLFTPHPTKPGLWRFESRVDDLIVLSTSHKLRPVQMETLIQGHPLLHGALIVGQGKPEPLLILEPKPGADQGMNPDAIISGVWPVIEEANRLAPSYAQIKRSRVLVATADRPFIRAPKGSVVRKLTTALYQEDIDAVFDASNSSATADNLTSYGLRSSLEPGMRQFVRKHVQEHLAKTDLSDNENFFVCGLDSLGASRLSKSLQQALATLQKQTDGPGMSLGVIYRHPTIEELASALLDFVLHGSTPELLSSKSVKGMEELLEEYTQDLRPAVQSSDIQQHQHSNDQLCVALLGPRGSLGPNILKELLDDPRVTKIYCLSRGENGREKMSTIFDQRGLKRDLDDQRLVWMSIDLKKPRLGLSGADYGELLQKTNIFIHNAWKVNFSWALDSYKPEYLSSVRELVDFSYDSALRARIVFISSISSVQEWAAVYPDTPVPEEIPSAYEVASPLGYGQSKHLSERILAKASAISGVPVTLLRVGQVAGPTSLGYGKWSREEWIPSMTAISKTLRTIPNDVPEIDWVPADLAARAVCELALLPAQPSENTPGAEQLNIFNVVNPKLSDWTRYAALLQKRLGQDAKLVRLTEWVDELVGFDLKTVSEEQADAAAKIMPFFQHLAETAARGVALQPKFDTSNASRASVTMQQMREVDEELMNLWFDQWGI